MLAWFWLKKQKAESGKHKAKSLKLKAESLFITYVLSAFCSYYNKLSSLCSIGMMHNASFLLSAIVRNGGRILVAFVVVNGYSLIVNS